MSNKTIEIILRVRPTKKPFNGLALKEEENKCDIFIPKDKESGYINNTKEHFSFEFNQVLNMQAKQEDVFKNVAKEVCDSAIEGFNGTLFAYGQTGSGKTFTMTGGTEKYNDRGIIPRTISYLFSEASKRQDLIFQISISYLEIYGNNGYDLLDENHQSKKLEDLPPVIPRETEDEEIILSGLSLHKAEKEDDAINLLFIGDTNRVVCETPKNDASTRSHCIFIIMLETRKPNSDVKTISRIHLVDLSGSERIGKTGVEGKLAQEARNINLSLHYLEHVIVCLNKSANGENIHIPYRNSLMTLVLRDSLGGNCKTKMIATISAEEGDIDESISTCRFAQRVALIKNYVVKNEAVDPSVIIERLKRENALLKAELAMLKGSEVRDSLEQEEREQCKKLVQDFINSNDPQSTIILSDRLQINECFYFFKHIYKDILIKYEKGGGQINNFSEKKQKDANLKDSQVQQKQIESTDALQYQDEIRRLKLQIQQRDNEILILLNVVNKNKTSQNQQQQVTIPVYKQDEDKQNELLKSIVKEPKPISFPQYDKDNLITGGKEYIDDQQKQNTKQSNQTDYKSSQATFSTLNKYSNDNSIVTNKGSQQIESGNDMNSSLLSSQNDKLMTEVNQMLIVPLNLSVEQLMDRANCFELFRKSYRKNEANEENKIILKDKFNNARQLGQIVNQSRQRINELKTLIEDLRKEAALQGLVEGNNENKHPDEEKYQLEIEKQKRIYKENFDLLKEEKADIERIQKILERNKEKLQKDFQQWLDVMIKQRQSLVQPLIQKSNIDNNKEIQKIKDKDVEKNLEQFYKSRDAIYKN